MEVEREDLDLLYLAVSPLFSLRLLVERLVLVLLVGYFLDLVRKHVAVVGSNSEDVVVAAERAHSVLRLLHDLRPLVDNTLLAFFAKWLHICSFLLNIIFCQDITFK